MSKLQKYIQDKNKTHLIFDFDETIGTLIIDWSGVRNEVKKIIREYESDFDYDFNTRTVTVCNEYVKKYGKEIRDKFRKLTEDYENKYVTGLDVNQEVLDIIKNSSKKIKYIWSSNSRKIIIRFLTELSIENQFEKIITKDEVDFLKPKPDGFELIYDGVTPKEKYLMIGDSDADQGASIASDIDFYRV
jgi:HAD superfamily hydrolase (TIGR01549 family)